VRQFTTSSDVAVFVGDHLGETLRHAGLNTVDATGEVSLWSGMITGDATRWGRSYNLDNYCEVMSDMTLRAVFNLLSNAGFRAALSAH
jgi:hypothetical protein